VVSAERESSVHSSNRVHDELQAPVSATRILLVEGDAVLSRAVSIALEAHGLSVDVVDPAGTTRLISRIATARPDLVLADLEAQDPRGDRLVKSIRTATCVPIIVMSDAHRRSEGASLLLSGADDVIGKPVAITSLLDSIRRVIAPPQVPVATSCR